MTTNLEETMRLFMTCLLFLVPAAAAAEQPLDSEMAYFDAVGSEGHATDSIALATAQQALCEDAAKLAAGNIKLANATNLRNIALVDIQIGNTAYDAGDYDDAEDKYRDAEGKCTGDATNAERLADEAYQLYLEGTPTPQARVRQRSWWVAVLRFLGGGPVVLEAA